MGTVYEQPSRSDFDRWEAKLAEGTPPTAAARELGYTCSAFRRADKQRHADALELSREARGLVVDDRMEQWVMEDGAAPALRIAWAKRWQPAYADHSRVELTGSEGGPIEIEDRSASLNDVARVLVEVGALHSSGAASGEMADPPPVLAESAEG